MENILRETSNLIKLRRRVVVYLPNKKVKTRQLAADLLNLPKHNQATCLDMFIDVKLAKKNFWFSTPWPKHWLNEMAVKIIVVWSGYLK